MKKANGVFIGLLFIIGIFVAYLISKNINERVQINDENIRYLDSIARKTWDYFEDYIIEENMYQTKVFLHERKSR